MCGVYLPRPTAEPAGRIQGSFGIPLAVRIKAFAVLKSPCSVVITIALGSEARYLLLEEQRTGEQDCWGQRVRHCSNTLDFGELDIQVELNKSRRTEGHSLMGGESKLRSS